MDLTLKTKEVVKFGLRLNTLRSIKDRGECATNDQGYVCRSSRVSCQLKNFLKMVEPLIKPYFTKANGATRTSVHNVCYSVRTHVLKFRFNQIGGWNEAAGNS